ncbi:MAG: hypothetical protein HRT90_07745 [Candidatus Margulisbacteria bacterium]|nr:hypothetical protein [Candidatus Margulisiibacteriota bacterium]
MLIKDVVEEDEEIKLFVAAFYHVHLMHCPRIQEKLIEMGITDECVWKKYLIGYANGHLATFLENKSDIKNILISIGLITRNKNGSIREYMNNNIVFPIYNIHGNIESFVGSNHIIPPNYVTQKGNLNIATETIDELSSKLQNMLINLLCISRSIQPSHPFERKLILDILQILAKVSDVLLDYEREEDCEKPPYP